MRKAKLKLLMLLAAGAVLYTACRKADQQRHYPDETEKDLSDEFFRTKAGVQPVTYLVLNEIRRRNEKLSFANEFSHKSGLPV